MGVTTNISAGVGFQCRISWDIFVVAARAEEKDGGDGTCILGKDCLVINLWSLAFKVLLQAKAWRRRSSELKSYQSREKVISHTAPAIGDNARESQLIRTPPMAP